MLHLDYEFGNRPASRHSFSQRLHKIAPSEDPSVYICKGCLAKSFKTVAKRKPGYNITHLINYYADSAYILVIRQLLSLDYSGFIRDIIRDWPFINPASVRDKSRKSL
jgi:hypothetical protein